MFMPSKVHIVPLISKNNEVKPVIIIMFISNGDKILKENRKWLQQPSSFNRGNDCAWQGWYWRNANGKEFLYCMKTEYWYDVK